MDTNQLTILNLNTYIEFLQAQVAERNERIESQAELVEALDDVVVALREEIKALKDLVNEQDRLLSFLP